MKKVVNNLKTSWKVIYRMLVCISVIALSSKLTTMALESKYTTDFGTEENEIQEIIDYDTLCMRELSVQTIKTLDNEPTENKEKIITEEEIPIQTEEIESKETQERKINYVFTNAEKVLADRGENIYVVSKENIHETLDEDNYRMVLDDETYEVLLRVVEAEVTGTTYTYKGNKVSEEEMLLSKIRVAQVFMNRVEDTNGFKDITTLYGALTQKNASSTFNDGRYYTVTVCDLTKEAVELALRKDTPDYTNGALFFNSCTTSIPYGEYMFTDEVGHHFFK